MPRLFLLDGTALAYRSHFALQRSDLTTPEGLPSGATYGFTMTLRRILEQEQPDAIAVAFDPPGKTFRHERYEPYKATREKAPDEMKAQLEWLREVVHAHGVPLFEVPGYEADDVIGTLATTGIAKGYEVLIVTGDKDFMQLVGPALSLYNVFKRGEDLVMENVAEVDAKFGTTPDRVIDVLAIMGDASDNVPGVKGIGEKGATKLIKEFGSVAGVLERLDEVKGKQREYIERDREQLLLSRELVTIDIAVPLDPGFEAVGPPRPDNAALRELFQRMGFISLIKKVEAEPEPAGGKREYVTVTDRAGFEAMERELRAAGTFALDTETTSLFPLEAELVGVSFSCQAGRAFYVPVNNDPPVMDGGREAVIDALRPLLTDPGLTRIGQNYKYDALVLYANGVPMPPPDFDTMVASFAVAGSARRHGLDELALHYFRIKKIPTKDVIGRGQKQLTMDQIDVDTVSEYACEDADVTWRLFEVLKDELVERNAEELFRKLEMPLVSVLTAMEQRGIRLDTELLSEIGAELDADIESHAAAFRALAGDDEINLNSPKMLGELFFERLNIQDAAGVKRPKKTKTGWATDHETLTTKYGEVPVVRKLLEYREVQKLKSTYVDALPRYVNQKTGRVHCSFSQVTAATGRLASSDPNLQNIPIRTDRGRRLRAAFVAREADEHGEWCLISADYSQVELRIMAHLSGDEKLQQAFAEGRDIHAATASVVFDVMEPMVTREMRTRAKAINYGLLYGMGPARLARETQLTLPEAKTFIERYFASFPKVQVWREATLDFVREEGYVETLMGRRRPIPGIDAESGRSRAFAENAALNTPMQGSAADIIKQAMIDLERRLGESPLAGQMLLQVHDELVVEAPLGQVEETTALVSECMEHAVELAVPLEVDTGHGRTWLDAH
jgi:DNA polymerase-1